jgi:hypothetical protein
MEQVGQVRVGRLRQAVGPEVVLYDTVEGTRSAAFGMSDHGTAGPEVLLDPTYERGAGTILAREGVREDYLVVHGGQE